MQDHYTVIKLSDWEIIANDLVEYLNQHQEIKIVLLDGNLGAGKTTFVQFIGKRLGVMDMIQSPTYALVNEYKTQRDKLIYHLDLYRIKSHQELIEAGIIDIIDSGNLCFIEWSNLILPLLYKKSLNVKIELVENGNRSINLQRI